MKRPAKNKILKCTYFGAILVIFFGASLIDGAKTSGQFTAGTALCFAALAYMGLFTWINRRSRFFN